MIILERWFTFSIYIKTQFRCHILFQYWILFRVLLQPIISIIKENDQSKLKQFFSQVYITLIRPEIAIIGFIEIEILTTFICLILIFHKIFMCLLLYKHKNLDECNQSLFFKRISYFICYYESILCKFLGISLQTILFILLQQNKESIGICLFSIALIVIIQVEIIIGFFVSEDPLTYKIQIYESKNKQFLQLTNNILILIQNTIYCLFKTQENQEFIITINSYFLIVIQIFNLFDLYYNIISYSSIKIQITLILIFFQIFFSIISIIELSSSSSHEYIIIFIILFPILLYVCKALYQSKITKGLIDIHQQIEKLEQFNFKTSIMLQLNQMFNNNPSTKIINDTFIMIYHKRLCSDTKCFCQIISNINDINKTAPLSWGQYHEFYLNKLNQFYNFQFQNVQSNREQLLTEVIEQSILQYDLGAEFMTIKTLYKILHCHEQNIYFKLQISAQKQKQGNNTKVETNHFIVSNYSETNDLLEQNFNFKVKLRIIQRCRLQILLYLAKRKMKNQFTQSFFTYQSNIVAEQLSKFLVFQFQLNEIQSVIIKQIQQKLNYYQKLLSDDSFNLNNILQITKNTCKSLISADKILQDGFIKFPCISIQNAICYYEIEISNNYFKAKKINNQAAISDDKFLSFSSSSINKDKIGYLLIEIAGDLAGSEIKFASNQFLKIYQRKNFDNKLKIEDLLPHFISKNHQKYIEKFIMCGRSKYYQNFQLSYIQMQDGFIKEIQMSYDITQAENNLNNLQFAVFFSDIQDQKGFLIVDMYQQNVQFSENFFKILGLSEKEIKFLRQSYIAQQINIYFVIPNFDQLIQDIEENSITTTEFYFINVYSLFSTILTEKQKVGNSANSITKVFWQKREKLVKYNIQIKINKFQSYEIIYYTIEIVSTLKFDEEQNKSFISNEVSIQENQESDSSIFIESDSQNQPNKFHNLDLSKRDHRQSQEKIIESISQPRIQILEIQKDYTPNESSSETKRIFQSNNQQKFFSQKISQADLQAFISEKRLEIEQQEQDEQEVIKVENLSDHSSIQDEQNKRYSKKFELIEKLMRPKRPLMLIQILSLLTLQNVLFTIFSLLAITVMFVDLQQALSEIDKISLHSSLMVKYDLFFSSKAVIVIYQSYLNQKILDQITFNNLVKPFTQNLQSIYFDYQNDLVVNFENQNIQMYLDNEFIIIKQLESLNNFSVNENNVTIREALIIALQYQYQNLDAFLNQKQIQYSSFQIFQQANYINIHQKLETLTENLLNESINRNEAVANKWMIIWILFQIGALILAIFNFICYYQYVGFYDKFFITLKLIEKDVIQAEIEKYKETVKSIKDNSKLLFEYAIDNNLQNQPKKGNSLTKRKKDLVNQRITKLRRFSSFMLIFVLNLIFGGYSAVINEQTQIYISKYAKTAILFKLFQDLSLSSGNCYLYKEILESQNLYTFYFPADRDKLYQMLNESQISISLFLNVSNEIDFSNYLATQGFISQFNSMKMNDLCIYSKNYLQSFCSLAFEGVLTQGLIRTLSYIQSDIQTQRTINNFTVKTENKFYEQEGNQIVTRAFLNMSQTFKNDLSTLTTNQTDLTFYLSIAFFCYSFIVTFCLLFYIRQQLTLEYYVIRRVISLIPRSLLVEDETIDRYLREIALQQDLI